MFKILFVALATFTMVGCSSLNPPKEYYAAQMKTSDKTAEIASKPMFEMRGFTCDAEDKADCYLAVRDPNAAKYVRGIDKGTTSADLAMKVIDSATSLGGLAIKASAVKSIVSSVTDRMGDQYNVNGETVAVNGDVDTSNHSINDSYNDSSDNSNNSVNTYDSNNDSSVAYADSYNAFTDSYNADSQNDQSDNSDNSVDSSDNSTDTSDNSDNSDNSVDNTDNTNNAVTNPAYSVTVVDDGVTTTTTITQP